MTYDYNLQVNQKGLKAFTVNPHEDIFSLYITVPIKEEEERKRREEEEKRIAEEKERKEQERLRKIREENEKKQKLAKEASKKAKGKLGRPVIDPNERHTMSEEELRAFCKTIDESDTYPIKGLIDTFSEETKVLDLKFMLRLANTTICRETPDP